MENKHVLELFEVEADYSTVLTALRTQSRIVNRFDRYRTRSGVPMTAINNAWPVFSGGKLLGVVDTEMDTLTDAVPNVERITRIPNADGEVVIVRPPDTHSKAQGTVALYLKEGNTVRFSDPNGLRVRAQGVQKVPSAE